MARHRLNDTRALTAQPPGGNQEHSVSVRKIDDGFIVRTSTCNPETGEYKSREQYHERAPRIIAPRVARGPAPENEGSLRDTMAYLNDKG